MGRACITSCFPVREVTKCLEYLGGKSVVTSVRLNTQPNLTPKSSTHPDRWPVILEVSPTANRLKHISRICVLQFNVGLYCRGSVETDEFLKTLGFDIPDLFVKNFQNEKFTKGVTD